MKIIVALIIFSLIIIFHELGHFLFAKKCGVRVNEFSLGLGPTICSIQGKETKFSLKLLPFGGACMMEGEDSESDDDRAFNKKTVWQRFQIVFAGPFFNFIMAFVLSVIFIGCVGYDAPVLSDVMPGYSAEAAGLKAGDEIVALNNYHVHFYQEISIYTFFHTGENINVTYKRGDEKHTALLIPRLDEESGRYLLGIIGSYERTKGNAFTTIAYGFYEIKYQIYVTFKSLGQLITGRLGANELSGPVGIVSTIGDVYEESAADGVFYVVMNMISIAILLSANLGVMNLLPLPALDGGRLLIFIVEAIRRKKMNEELEGKIHFVGFMLLMLLMVFVMYNDIAKLISGNL